VDYGKIMLYVLVILMGIFLYALLQGYMISLDTSSWTFLGHVEAALFLNITPVLFLISIILIPVYFIVQEAE